MRRRSGRNNPPSIKVPSEVREQIDSRKDDPVMSIVVIPPRVRASSPKRIADSHDARSASQRSSTRSYSSLQFANDVYGTYRTPASKRSKVTVIKDIPYKSRLRK